MHTSPALYIRGPYRVVAGSPDQPEPRFVVLDTAGTWLREDCSFPAACGWVDARIAEIEAAGPAPTALTPRRLHR